jgi:3-deoxy-manno-octulosonate cytidylyltransferase (CMP-KDO synthetase)
MIAMLPARLASVRLPNKLLLADTGKPLILHSIDNVIASDLFSAVIVASEDQKICELVHGYRRVTAVLTPPCVNGTQRLAWAASELQLNDAETVVDVQADEPMLPHAVMRQVCELLLTSQLASAAYWDDTPSDQHGVKLVVDAMGDALYFSRAAIPHGVERQLHHIGIYGFRAATLRTYTLPPDWFGGESLEQLGWLWAGQRMRIAVVAPFDHVAIDTIWQYRAFTRKYR